MKKTNHFGYTHLYNKLLAEYSKNSFWLLIFGGLIFLSLTALTMTLLGMNTQTNIHFSSCIEYVVSGIYLVFGYGLVIYIVLIIFLTLLYKQDIREITRHITVHLLLSESSPFMPKRNGLDEAEIRHLQHIASTEQNAADWRSSFINLVIIGTISMFFWISREQSTLWPSTIIGICQPQNWKDWFFPAVIFLYLISIIVTLFNQYRTFLATELINRAIIFACEEALSLREIQDSNRIDLTIRQSSLWIANQCGYNLVNKDIYLKWRIPHGQAVRPPSEINIEEEKIILIDSSAYEQYIPK